VEPGDNDKVKLERSYFLKELSTRLKFLAYKYDLAVIIINNVVSSFSEEYKKSKQV